MSVLACSRAWALVKYVRWLLQASKLKLTDQLGSHPRPPTSLSRPCTVALYSCTAQLRCVLGVESVLIIAHHPPREQRECHDRSDLSVHDVVVVAATG